MKIQFLLFVLGCVSLASCKKDQIVGKGKIVTEERTFNNFSEIEVSEGIDLELTQSGPEKVEVEAHENLVDKILITQTAQKLQITMQNDVNIWSGTRKVKINIVNLQILNGMEGVNIKALDTLKLAKLTLNLHEGSEMSSSIICTDLDVNLTEGSDLNISGKSNNLKLVCKEGSEFRDYTFVTNYLNCLAKAGSDVYITVNNKMDIVANEASSVYYKGNGLIQSQVLTGGSVLIKK
jgi:Putative auto-transporter adhesin, head GIN domain